MKYGAYQKSLFSPFEAPVLFSLIHSSLWPFRFSSDLVLYLPSSPSSFFLRLARLSYLRVGFILPLIIPTTLFCSHFYFDSTTESTFLVYASISRISGLFSLTFQVKPGCLIPPRCRFGFSGFLQIPIGSSSRRAPLDSRFRPGSQPTCLFSQPSGSSDRPKFSLSFPLTFQSE